MVVCRPLGEYWNLMAHMVSQFFFLLFCIFHELEKRAEYLKIDALYQQIRLDLETNDHVTSQWIKNLSKKAL